MAKTLETINDDPARPKLRKMRRLRAQAPTKPSAASLRSGVRVAIWGMSSALTTSRGVCPGEATHTKPPGPGGLAPALGSLNSLDQRRRVVHTAAQAVPLHVLVISSPEPLYLLNPAFVPYKSPESDSFRNPKAARLLCSGWPARYDVGKAGNCEW